VKDLQVEPRGPGVYRVTGGSEPHRVEIAADVARCDCKGYQYRHRCRHLDAVAAYLQLAPIAPVPAGPAFDDAPPPEPPADLDVGVDVDAVALEAGPFGDAPPAPAPAPPADPFAVFVEKWERKRTKRGRSEQAA